jgi:hypothetical protein
MKGLFKLENGNEIRVELTDEGLLKLLDAEKPAKLTGWERLPDKTYYLLDDEGVARQDTDNNFNLIDDSRYNVGNYFSTLEKAEEESAETILKRKMKRFRELNDPIDWNHFGGKFFISGSCGRLSIELDWNRSFGTIYFNSREFAEKALETFRPELEKYYGIHQK